MCLIFITIYFCLLFTVLKVTIFWRQTFYVLNREGETERSPEVPSGVFREFGINSVGSGQWV